jgi:hypothetical protein
MRYNNTCNAFMQYIHYKKELQQMTSQELLTMLTRLPHDAVIMVEHNGEIIEPYKMNVEMSTDLYEQRDHIILKCK